MGIAAGLKDHQLIAQAKAGDSEAFAELFHRSRNRVFLHLTRFVGFHDAEDLLHDTFLKAQDGIGNLSTENFRSWLFRIARNAAISFLRKRRRQTGQEMELVSDPTSDEPINELIEHRDLTVFRGCWSKLTPLEQELIRAKFRGEGAETTAKRLGLKNAEEVYTLRHRAMNKLRSCVEKGGS